MSNPSQEDAIKSWLGTGSINFFGMPFAGKDSQAHALQNITGGQVLGGGDILRNSIIPDDIQEIMRSGELIPTEEYVRIVLPYLASEAFSDGPLLLSSVGRWQGEEQSVIDALQKAGHPLKAAIHLKFNEHAAIERLLEEGSVDTRGARNDDKVEVLKKRISEFKEKTIPVIEFYRTHGLLIEVDATLPKVEVSEMILTSLADKALQD